MKLRCCRAHTAVLYTLKALCPQCGKDTKDAHYKFIKLKDAKDTTKSHENTTSSLPRSTEEKTEMPS